MSVRAGVSAGVDLAIALTADIAGVAQPIQLTWAVAAVGGWGARELPI
jgi:hypothetical protein